jgi:hypothetical protein
MAGFYTSENIRKAIETVEEIFGELELPIRASFKSRVADTLEILRAAEEFQMEDELNAKDMPDVC